MRGTINFVTGGMSDYDKAKVRENLVIGDVIPIRKTNGRRGATNNKYKILAKYEHYFIVDSGNYKDSFLYIDLFSNHQEEEE